LQLQYDGPLSNFAFNFNLRRYAAGVSGTLKIILKDKVLNKVANPAAAVVDVKLELVDGRGLHSSTSHLNISTRKSNNPRNMSTHLRLITCQHSAVAADTRPLLGST